MARYYTKAIVHYEQTTVEQNKKIEDKAFKLQKMFTDLDVEFNSGGPCWWPYIVIESSDETQVKKYVSLIEFYIQRFKGAKVT